MNPPKTARQTGPEGAGQDRTPSLVIALLVAEGKKRGHEVIRLPRDGLAMLGIDAMAIKDVVITHMHYDHAGTPDEFRQPVSISRRRNCNSRQDVICATILSGTHSPSTMSAG
jgi:ribonuclease BN (tRNA processing enzyme)